MRHSDGVKVIIYFFYVRDERKLDKTSFFRWSFQFQSYVQLTRLQLLKKPTTCSVKIIERSIQNNRYCFLENAKKEGSLSGAELETLFSWYDWLNSNIGLPLDLIVYLRTSPEVAYERLKKRGRKEEAGVPLQFLEVRLNKLERSG